MELIEDDIKFVRSLLPSHYDVHESTTRGSIHCVSKTGLKTPEGNDDDEAFDGFFIEVKEHFGDRFQEVFHNTCAWHINFTIYLKQP